ncbi:MAG: hypothetical protein K2X66_08865 [Cyanobacteria bacterium]|nr:hypothetical protein [Cyanobacteriota bacterium]
MSNELLEIIRGLRHQLMLKNAEIHRVSERSAKYLNLEGQYKRLRTEYAKLRKEVDGLYEALSLKAKQIKYLQYILVKKGILNNVLTLENLETL